MCGRALGRTSCSRAALRVAHRCSSLSSAERRGDPLGGYFKLFEGVSLCPSPCALAARPSPINLRARAHQRGSATTARLAKAIRSNRKRGHARKNILVAVRVYVRALNDADIVAAPADDLIRTPDLPKLPVYLPRPLEPDTQPPGPRWRTAGSSFRVSPSPQTPSLWPRAQYMPPTVIVDAISRALCDGDSDVGCGGSHGAVAGLRRLSDRTSKARLSRPRACDTSAMGGLIVRPAGSTHRICTASTVTSEHGCAGEGCSFTPVTPEGVATIDIAERFAELLESGTAVEIAGWDTNGDASSARFVSQTFTRTAGTLRAYHSETSSARPPPAAERLRAGAYPTNLGVRYTLFDSSVLAAKVYPACARRRLDGPPRHCPDLPHSQSRQTGVAAGKTRLPITVPVEGRPTKERTGPAPSHRTTCTITASMPPSASQDPMRWLAPPRKDRAAVPLEKRLADGVGHLRANSGCCERPWRFRPSEIDGWGRAGGAPGDANDAGR